MADKISDLKRKFEGEKIGEYVIEKYIGGGGIAHVWKARHSELDQQYAAIKILRQEFNHNKKIIKRFKQGMKIVCDHRNNPNIVNWIGGGYVPHLEAHYFSMEYINGIDLANLIEKRKKRKIYFRWDEILFIFESIANALNDLHAFGRVHRDLKPDNILIETNNIYNLKKDKSRILLIDFDIVKTIADPQTTVDSKMGTWGYCPPEQQQSAKNATKQSDIYSLGIILFELITTERIGIELSGITTHVEEEAQKRGYPERVKEIVSKALSVNPRQRFSNVKEMYKELVGEEGSKSTLVVSKIPIRRLLPKIAALLLFLALFITASFWIVNKGGDLLHEGQLTFNNDSNEQNSDQSMVTINEDTITREQDATSIETPPTLDVVNYTIAINTKPAGATVFLNGNEIGHTPIENQLVSAGNNNFQFEHDDYETRQITRKINSDTTLQLTLNPLPGQLELELSNTNIIGVTLEREGNQYQPVAAQNTIYTFHGLSPGEYYYKINSDYSEYTDACTIRSNRLTEIRLQYSPVKVTVIPYAKQIEIMKFINERPYTIVNVDSSSLECSLPAGETFQVKIINPDTIPIFRDLTVSQDPDQNVIRASFLERGFLTVLSSLNDSTFEGGEIYINGVHRKDWMTTKTFEMLEGKYQVKVKYNNLIPEDSVVTVDVHPGKMNRLEYKFMNEGN